MPSDAQKRPQTRRRRREGTGNHPRPTRPFYALLGAFSAMPEPPHCPHLPSDAQKPSGFLVCHHPWGEDVGLPVLCLIRQILSGCKMAVIGPYTPARGFANGMRPTVRPTSPARYARRLRDLPGSDAGGAAGAGPCHPHSRRPSPTSLRLRTVERTSQARGPTTPSAPCAKHHDAPVSLATASLTALLRHYHGTATG